MERMVNINAIMSGSTGGSLAGANITSEGGGQIVNIGGCDFRPWLEMLKIADARNERLFYALANAYETIADLRSQIAKYESINTLNAGNNGK